LCLTIAQTPVPQLSITQLAWRFFSARWPSGKYRPAFIGSSFTPTFGRPDLMRDALVVSNWLCAATERIICKSSRLDVYCDLYSSRRRLKRRGANTVKGQFLPGSNGLSATYAEGNTQLIYRGVGKCFFYEQIPSSPLLGIFKPDTQVM